MSDDAGLEIQEFLAANPDEVQNVSRIVGMNVSTGGIDGQVSVRFRMTCYQELCPTEDTEVIYMDLDVARDLEYRLHAIIAIVDAAAAARKESVEG